MTKYVVFWAIYTVIENILSILLTSHLSPENALFPLLILISCYAYFFFIILITLELIQQHSKIDFTNPIKLTFIIVTSCLSFYAPLLMNFILSSLYFSQFSPLFMTLIFVTVYPFTMSVLVPLVDLMRIILYTQQYGSNSFEAQYHREKFLHSMNKLYGKSFENVLNFLKKVKTKNNAYNLTQKN